MKIFIYIILMLCSLNSFCQNLITVFKTPQTVPAGKKWILPTNQKILIEISMSSLNSGTKCNANFYSNPQIITTIVEGEYGRPNKVYGILFAESGKAPYSNGYTYSIVPLSIVDENFSLSSLSTTSVEDAGGKQITFMPGQKVYVSECLRSIQLVEQKLNQSELTEINKKNKEQEEKEKSMKYIPSGERLLTVTNSSLEGIDDLSNHGITGIKKIIISDSQKSFTIINCKGVISKYGIGQIKNLENGKQEIEIGMFDMATLTFNSDHVSIEIFVRHRQDMGNTYVNAKATLQTISKEQEDSIENEIKAQNITDSIKENTYPKYVSSKKIFEGFFIKKKGNGELKVQWINENKSIVNFAAVNEIILKQLDEIPFYPGLRSKIEEQMKTKGSGMYYLSLDIVQRLQEVKKGVMQTDTQNITVHEFYKGDYGNPTERYK